MKIFSTKERKKISHRHKKTGSLRKTIEGAALLSVSLALIEALYFGGLFIKSHTDSWNLQTNIIYNTEKQQEALDSIYIKLPESGIVDQLRAESRSWALIIEEMEKTAGISFQEITGKDDEISILGHTVDTGGESLGSLADITAALDNLPFVREIIIESTDKKYISEKTFESSFQLKAQIDWNSLREKIAGMESREVFGVNSDLDQVENLVATGEVNGRKASISLSWNKVEDADLYLIFGGPKEDDFRFLGSVSQNKFDFQPEDPRETYTFQVFPVDQNGRYGTHAGIVTARAGDKQAPAKITDIKILSALSSSSQGEDMIQIALTWTANTEKTDQEYLIFSGPSQNNLHLVDKTTTNYFSITKPLVNVDTIWAIITVDTSGNRSEPSFVTLP